MSYPDYKYGTGLSNVGSYQVSGKPFVTGSLTVPNSASATPLRIEFPSVTRWFTVINVDSKHMRVGFSEEGVKGSNYFLVHEDNHPTQNGPYELKVTELYLLSDTGQAITEASVLAGLTGISVDRINNISPSGSNWSGSIGVG
jgi:hypothetical protein